MRYRAWQYMAISLYNGKYGGAAFVIIYLISLLILGLPILIMEFSIGRGGQSDIAGSYKVLEKEGHKWHIIGYIQMLGCLIFNDVLHKRYRLEHNLRLLYAYGSY